MLTFYDTEVGKKIVKLTPKLTESSIQAGHNWAEANKELLEEKLKPIIEAEKERYSYESLYDPTEEFKKLNPYTFSTPKNAKSGFKSEKFPYTIHYDAKVWTELDCSQINGMADACFYIEGEDTFSMIIAENEEGDLPHLKAAALVNAYSVASDVVVKEVGLLEVNFAECVFEHCDFSMTNLANTTLREVEFKDCKLLGTRFEDCNAFLLKMGFRDCQMNLSSFNQLQLKQTVFGLLSIFLLTLITIEFVGQNFRLPM